MAFSAFVVVISLLFMGGGLAKLAGVDVMRRDAERFDLKYGTYRLIGAAELAGGLALCVARFASQPLLGIVAAAGLTALMSGAVVVHLKAKDAVAKTVPAAAFGVITAVIAYFFAAS
ncbi:DoxX family protein [Amycolatopsis sp. EV170708-02-1]|uniref:DoxX family protein n=1 Tax=Amycolatopsis sp. EV170708-02-1 TaxID=2919322 RepID=UPI001F0C88AC|nr:DoxX family protein [Amycolatopsis sp. EV170708-02-1]UMP06737.1 DoxX family protein [Amycolatopsis sp. EV170708-02-1]